MQFGFRRSLSLFFSFFLAWMGLRFLLPLVWPFLFGALLALAAEPAVGFLSRRLRLPRAVSVGIGVSVLFLFLFSGLLLLGAAALRELGKLSDFLPDIARTVHNGIWLLRSWLIGLTEHTPESIRFLIQDGIQTLFSGSTALLEQTVRYILGFAGNLLAGLPDSALAVSTAILSAFMISAKLPGLRQLLSQKLPRERMKRITDTWQRIRRAVTGWFFAQFKLIAVTFGILLLGFVLLRIPRGAVWAAVVSLVDAFPILGTGTVLLPWGLICLLQGDSARAIGLLGLYTTVSLVRSCLEPKLVGNHLGLDPLVTLAALYVGFQLWGIGGMLLAPLLTVAAIQAIPRAAD